jgi:N-acetylneuraminate synthase|tara:strand:- start:512 stop:1381 length:870 start_codon:yes stop_codon:yes gene_type:complete
MASSTVKIGENEIGDGNRCYIVAEIGINHNGSLDLAKKLIDVAIESGCDAVKFQKRTVEVVYSTEELALLRESPFGSTNGDLKRALEFGEKEYTEIDRYCRKLGIDWMASCWDENSVDFMEQFNPPCYKIASASLTDDQLLQHHRNYERPIILSTGMSTEEQIQHAVGVLGSDQLILLHCTSTYPAAAEELNLRVIETLKRTFPVPVGYSGHESSFLPTFAAVMMGANVIERHITLDRAMWGSDQAASLEPAAFERLIKYVRELDVILGDGIMKVYDSELPIIKKLRRK